MRTLIAFIVTVGLAVSAYAAEFTGPQPKLPTAALIIDTAKGPAQFTAEMAVTSRQQEQGLMFRKSIAPNEGMLFDFGKEQETAFWMKNTLIPLDMLFIDKTGRIVRTVERAVPESLTPISSGEPVRAVLEVNSGTASRLEIQPGDVVIHPIFQR